MECDTSKTNCREVYNFLFNILTDAEIIEMSEVALDYSAALVVSLARHGLEFEGQEFRERCRHLILEVIRGIESDVSEQELQEVRHFMKCELNQAY